MKTFPDFAKNLGVLVLLGLAWDQGKKAICAIEDEVIRKAKLAVEQGSFRVGSSRNGLEKAKLRKEYGTQMMSFPDVMYPRRRRGD
jgi:hypothetical protein